MTRTETERAIDDAHARHVGDAEMIGLVLIADAIDGQPIYRARNRRAARAARQAGYCYASWRVRGSGYEPERLVRGWHA